MRYYPNQLSFFKERFILNTPVSLRVIAGEREEIERRSLEVSEKDFERLYGLFANRRIYELKEDDLVNGVVVEILDFLGYDTTINKEEVDAIQQKSFGIYRSGDVSVVVVPGGNSLRESGDSAFEPITIPLLIPWMLEVELGIVTDGSIWAICDPCGFAGDAHIVNLEMLIKMGSIVDLEQFHRYFGKRDPLNEGN